MISGQHETSKSPHPFVTLMHKLVGSESLIGAPQACAGDPMAAVWARAQAQGMALPLLLKPLPACSLPGAHKFRLIESLAGAKNVEHDGIVQQFVPHNGIVYKICVVGYQVRNEAAGVDCDVSNCVAIPIIHSICCLK